MRIAIVGDRDIDNADWVNWQIDEFLSTLESKDKKPTIISGGSRGVDSIVQDYAEAEGLDFVLFKPYHLIDNKVEFTPRFFFTRNKQIVDNSDFVLIMTSGEESGCRSIIRYCQKRNKPYIEIPYRDVPEEIA